MMFKKFRGSAPRFQKILVGFSIGAIVAGICHYGGVPQGATNAIVVGVSAGVAFGL